MKLYKINYRKPVYNRFGGKGFTTGFMFIEAHSQAEAREKFEHIAEQSGAALQLVELRDATETEEDRFYRGDEE